MANPEIDLVEPDPGRRAALLALLDGLSAAVRIFGPGAAVEGGVGPSLALVELEDGIEAAFGAGATDVARWPIGRAELRHRVGRLAERAALSSEASTDRRDLLALLELSEALSNIRDIDGTLHQIARRMAEVLGGRGSVVLLDDEHEHGVVVADSEDPKVENHPLPLDGYPEIVEVTRTRRPLLIDDVQNAPLLAGVRELIAEKPFGHTAVFPVTLDRRVQGVIMVRGPGARVEGLSERQLRFGRIVANATAIALRNARMYQSIRERTERVLSARIRAERRLRQLERYQRFFDLAGDGLMIVDGRGQIVFANRAALVMLGFDAEDVTQLRLHDLAVDEARPMADELVASVREGRHRTRVDIPIIRASGHRAVLSLSTASLDPELEELADARVQDVAAIISMRDVTETRAIEDELATTKDFLERLIQFSPDAIVAADMKGRILIFNPGAERLTGYTAAEAMSELNVAHLYPEGTAGEIMRRLRSDKFGGVGKYESGRHELATKGGDRVPIALAASLIYDDAEPIASVGIFADLRAQIRMEEELARAQRQLELSERQAAIVELAGTTAHELSQPLTSILGSAELMLRRIEPGSANQKTLERILSECERMTEILKKVGQITKYQTKPYMGHTNILDLDAASEGEE